MVLEAALSARNCTPPFPLIAASWDARSTRVAEGAFPKNKILYSDAREYTENIQDREEGGGGGREVPPQVRPSASDDWDMFAGKKANYAISRQVPSSMMEDTLPARSPTA